MAAPQVFTFAGPFFRTDEACAYLCYRGKHKLRSLYRWMVAKGVKPVRRSRRTLLLKKADIDRVLGEVHGEDSTKERLARHFLKTEERAS